MSLRERLGLADNDARLDYIDQASFLMLQATGRQQLMQCIWLYEHPIDLDGVRRFHENFGYGLAGRLIEPSPLPFGRHRWVAWEGPHAELEIAEPRPREALGDWLDERGQVPVDPEHGPGWHMAVLPMTDGSTAVCATGSHCLADGVGGLFQDICAVKGIRPDFGYPRPRSRTRVQAVVGDLRQTVRDLPEVGRALKLAAKLGWRRRHELRGSGSAPRPAAVTVDNPDEIVVVPAITVFIPLPEWDARAEALGGNGYSLMAGIAARLGERMGRRRPEDGNVTLLIAQSDRTLEDTRAHAMLFANVRVDPRPVATDLSGTRAVIRESLKKLREQAHEEEWGLLPLNPFVPKRAVQRMGDLWFGLGDLPVACSNLGDLDPVITRVDGTDAEYMLLRGIDQGLTRGYLERTGGQLVVVGGRVGANMSVNVVGYQAGRPNSKARLRELVAGVLDEFGLSGQYVV
ncbi:hypothetical protein [uncultured Mycolicibacterium sp.]|uniref:hypothetical protein n=1 Tax=uncultured Mycolicibacterium sp. TaxID=2320817 RepID=UPI0026210041|nr:hypothetical protein [uncultured Mycolicibacterium sp.]